jgi:hypothetical protein
MALTVTTVKKNVVGNQREWIGDITFDSSYPTGGELFEPSDVDPAYAKISQSVFFIVLCAINDATIADYRQVVYDQTNKKLQVFTAINTEAGNGTNQSAVNIRVLARYGAGI